MTPFLPRAQQIGSRQVAETLRKLAAEDRSQGKGTGCHIACFILESRSTLAGDSDA